MESFLSRSDIIFDVQLLFVTLICVSSPSEAMLYTNIKTFGLHSNDSSSG